MTEDYDSRFVRPNGLEVRRRRHENRWSPRDLVRAIDRASLQSSGLRETISPNVLGGIVVVNVAIPYRIPCLVADGLYCEPVDLLLAESAPPEGGT